MGKRAEHDRIRNPYHPLPDQGPHDRHWAAKRNLELTASAEMSRIADHPGRGRHLVGQPPVGMDGLEQRIEDRSWSA